MATKTSKNGQIKFKNVPKPKYYPSKEDAIEFIDFLKNYVGQAREHFTIESKPYRVDEGIYLMKLKYPKKFDKANVFFITSVNKDGEVIRSDDIFYETKEGFNISNFIRAKQLEFMKMLCEAFPKMEIYLNLNRKYKDTTECSIVFYWNPEDYKDELQDVENVEEITASIEDVSLEDEK